MKAEIFCDGKTREGLKKQIMAIVENKYKDLINKEQFDETYEKLSNDDEVLGIMISQLSILMDAALGESFYINLHNIPDFFLTCTDIQNFTVPDGVEIIGEEAFSCCKDLITITIPKSLKKIKKNAFKNCSNLKTIYYKGTANDADSVDIEDGNDDFRNSNVQFEK